jgi:small conductance mechanosensitive channel
LTIGYSPAPEEAASAAAAAVEFRAQQVESIFDAIYFQLIQLEDTLREQRGASDDQAANFPGAAPPLTTLPSPEPLPGNILNPNILAKPSPLPPSAADNAETQTSSVRRSTQELISRQLFDLRRNNRETHPFTPTVAVGVKNGQTVVFIPPQLKLGLAQQTIITVNEADEIANGKPIEILAYEWRDHIRASFDSVLWGHEIDQQYPWMRYQISVLGLIILGIPVVILAVIRSFLNRRDRRLRQQLDLLTRALTADTEKMESDTAKNRSEPPVTGPDNLTESPSPATHATAPRQFAWLPAFFRRLPGARSITVVKNTAIDSVSDAWQNLGDLAALTLKQQFLIKQQRNVINLITWILLWLQVSCFFIAGAFIVYIFPSIRSYTQLFIGQAMYFPLLWIGVTLIDKVVGIIIDSLLNRWAKNGQLLNSESNRYTLRVATYSPALKGSISFILTILGIIGTIWLFGINPLVLASFGGVAFVVAFLGRNVVEDMLNGALILWTDRYAIGDVIKIGDMSGFVENMNIYITQLRGGEGRLTTIPNGQILVVENLTKNWSRAECIFEIDQANDIEKALEVIKVVSEDMRHDDLWREKILEPAAILGVDNIASQGIRLQVWIKTQAGQHWSVGREFRLRVKNAFEAAAINLGVPRQQIRYEPLNSAQAAIAKGDAPFNPQAEGQETTD